MEQKYLIDTNVIIDNFGNKLPTKALDLLGDVEIIISVISKIEILGWHNASKLQLEPLYNFMEIATILQLNEAIINETILIRQIKKIGLGDAIIAATALYYNYTLVTRNEKDFSSIINLKILNPYNL